MQTGLAIGAEELEKVVLKSLRERSLLEDSAIVKRVIVRPQRTLVVVM